MKQVASTIWRSGIDFLFPPTCQLCGKDLGELSESSTLQLCTECRAQLLMRVQERCQVCSAFAGPNLDTSTGCGHCRTERYAFRSVSSLGNYDGPLRTAILAGKLQRRPEVLTALTRLLVKLDRERILDCQPDLILPIPHHWTDRILRSTAASETIAIRLSQTLKLPLDRHILRKIRRTPQQSQLNPSSRRQNLRNAFGLGRGVDLQGVRVLLVDDVLTTGTTCQRATRVLLTGGAESVNVVVLARGVGA